MSHAQPFLRPQASCRHHWMWFRGLEAAKALSHAPVEIVVIDRTNHHLFQPLLYQVATASLPAPAIAARFATSCASKTAAT